MKKILFYFTSLIFMFLLTSCEFSINMGSKESSEPNNPNLKYQIEDGEVVINDKNITSSLDIDDNYRVFYEIFTGSFSDSNGDGIGDLQGIINRLDYLNDGNPNSGKSLGIQGIWLTPIFTSPTYHKYDVTDYYSIDPSFGNMDDLKTLISECHKRNIKLIIDLPINHTGHKNQWFLEFCNAHKTNDTTNKYYDYYCYYTSGEAVPAGRSFNSVYGTSIFYECNFSGNMPELNYDNEQVRQDVLDIAKYYIHLGIDGFRFDAAKYIYFGEESKSAAFWNWYTTELKTIKPDIYIVGEVWSGDGITDIYYGQGLNCFNFTMSQAEGKIASTAKSGNVTVYTKYVESYLNKINSLSTDAMMHPFIANHDTDRAGGFLPLSTKHAYMAANLYILSNGSPFIYYGEEIGMKGSRGSANSDANRRLAMRWGDGDTIKDPSEATYNNEKYQINGTVVDHKADENSLYNYYKKLIMIRNAHPEIARGEYKALSSSKTTIGGFTSTYNGSTVCVIHNTANVDLEVDLASLNAAQFSIISAYIGQGDVTLENNILKIAAQTTVILK